MRSRDKHAPFFDKETLITPLKYTNFIGNKLYTQKLYKFNFARIIISKAVRPCSTVIKDRRFGPTIGDHLQCVRKNDWQGVHDTEDSLSLIHI